MTRGFISWPGLFRGDFLGQLGKLATLWYDEIFIQIAGEDEHLEGALERANDAGLISDDIAVEIAERWTPVPLTPDGSDPIRALATYDPVISNLAIQTVRDFNSRNNKDTSDPAIHLTAYSLLWTTRCWTSLSADSSCGFLTAGCAGDFIPKIFAPVTPPGYTPFREVASQPFPDLRELSWDRLFELRAMPPFEEFRAKLDDLQEAARTDDRSTTAQLIDEIFQFDLATLADAIGPTKHTVKIKAVSSAIPLPIPMPPVGVTSGDTDLREAYERRTRFGWLYFLLDFK